MALVACLALIPVGADATDEDCLRALASSQHVRSLNVARAVARSLYSLFLAHFRTPQVRLDLRPKLVDALSEPGKWIDVALARREGEQRLDFVRGLGGGVGVFRAFDDHASGVYEALQLLSGTQMPSGRFAANDPASGAFTAPRSGFARPLTIQGRVGAFVESGGGEARLPTYDIHNVDRFGFFFPQSAEIAVPWARSYLLLAARLDAQGIRPRPGSRGERFLRELRDLVNGRGAAMENEALGRELLALFGRHPA